MNDDLISQSALLNDIRKTIEESGCVNHEGEMLDCIRYAPAVDAVIPVRCKECLHRSQHECPMYHEEDIEWDDDGYIESEVIQHDYTKDDGFCDRGERRADE